MTAADWHTSTDPLAMVRHLRDRQSPGVRLFGWKLGPRRSLPEASVRHLLDTVCDLPPPTIDATQRGMRAAVRDRLSHPAELAAFAARVFAAGRIDPQRVAMTVNEQLLLLMLTADAGPNPPLADAIRCLFADPFHPPPDFAPWRTRTVTAIAEGIAADAALDRLPVLADALEDAGCDHAPVLHHLRAGGRHRPGCHALAAALGR